MIRPLNGPYYQTPTGVRLLLQVLPRAGRSSIEGLHGDRIRVRVAAPPVDGAANEALLAFLAERLGVRSGALRLVSGASGRRKVVEVTGLTLAQVADRLGVPAEPG